MTTKIQKFSFGGILLILVLKNQFSERTEGCGERMEFCWREMGGMREKNTCVRDSSMGFPCDSVIKNFPANAGATGDAGSIPGSGRSPRVGNGNYSSIPAGKSHGQTSLASYSSQGLKESDTAIRLSTQA